MDEQGKAYAGTSAASSTVCAAPNGANLIDDSQMNKDNSATAFASAAISPGCTAPTDDDLFVNILPMLCARPISVCRKLVLQQALEALGFSMHAETTHDNETNESLTAIQINVPPHIRVARMKTRLFYGDWSLTSNAAMQSACSNVLGYLQKVEVLTIDGIHSADLKQCQRELFRANSWAETFEQHAEKLQPPLSTMVKGKTPVLGISQAQANLNLMQERAYTVFKKTDEHQLPPPNSTKVASALNKGNSSGQAFVSLTGKGTVFSTHYPPRLRQKKTNIAVTLPRPEPAVATSNRVKRKLVRDSQRSQDEVATFPDILDPSSVPDDLSDEETYVRPDQITTGCAAPSLTVLPSSKEAIDLRARTVQPDSQARKRLFGNDDKKAAKLGDKVETKTEDM